MGFYFPEKQILIDDVRVRSIYKTDKKTVSMLKKSNVNSIYY